MWNSSEYSLHEASRHHHQDRYGEPLPPPPPERSGASRQSYYEQPYHHDHHYLHPQHQQQQFEPLPSPPPSPPATHSGFRHNQEVVMTSRCSTFMLTSMTMFSGAVTLVSLALAVSTDFWLFMEEPFRMSPDDLAKFNLTGPIESIMIYLRSGLWNVCTINLKEGNKSISDHCLRIDFNQEGTGRMDGAPRCMTIVGAIRVAAPLPVVSLILAVSGILMCALGSLKRNGKTVIAAVFYILSGLCLAVGVVLFISAIYDELGYHSQTTGHSKDFSYHYGWSFYVAGSAFVSSELSAVMCVTLYLRHNARVQDMVRIIPGLEDKLEGDLEEHVSETDKLDPATNDVIW